MDRMKHLQKAIIAFTKLNKTCNMKVAEEVGVSELQLKQFNYVQIIGSREWMTYGDLADILEITKPSVTSIANKLIKAGIVEKRQCRKDGRVYYLVLTEKGEKLYHSYDLAAEKTAAIIRERLNEKEVDELIRLLDKVLK